MTVAFVSAYPATVASAATAQISLNGTQVTSVEAIDGGFDPVAMLARVGEQVTVVVTDSAGEETTVTEFVKSGARPRVVRTSPMPRRTDVPLNAVVRVVFSTPMVVESVQEGMQLLNGSDVVPATVIAVDASQVSFELRPSAPLVSGVTYDIVIESGVRDVTGTSLGEATTARFTTTSSQAGAVRIITRTVGDSLDADGYSARLSRPTSGSAVRHAIRGSDTVLVTGWPAGASSVSLDGVSVNCEIEGGNNTQSVQVTAGGTIDVAFSVRCGRGSRLTVITVTTGADLDPDGYMMHLSKVGVSGIADVPVAINGSVLLPEVLLGAYGIGLSGTSPNCSVDTDPLGTYFSVGANDVAISLTITCLPVRQLAAVTGDGQDAEIYLINSNGIGSTRLTSNTSVDDNPAWSPDGSRIVFSSERDGNPEIYVMNADGSNPVRLTNSPGADSRPAWSPDGGRIAFDSDRDGNAEIYTMNADGSGLLRLTNAAGADLGPAWSPDGRRIAFASARTGTTHIYVMGNDGSAPTQVSQAEPATRLVQELESAWSPDGTAILFIGQGINGTGVELRLLVRIAPDGSNRTSTFALDGDYNGSADPAWSPDGRQIVSGLQCPTTVTDPCAHGLLLYRASDGLMTGQIYMSSSATGFHVHSPAWRP